MFIVPSDNQNCSIKLKLVTSNNSYLSANPRTHAPLARMLAFVLLVFISYGATAGAAHRHGNILKSVRAPAAATMSGAGNSGSTAKDTGTSGECLMCRLHQHLFAGLLHNLPGFIPPTVQPINATVAFIPYFSQTNAPRRGRAPPTAFTL
jgi:hypothetical protein